PPGGARSPCTDRFPATVTAPVLGVRAPVFGRGPAPPHGVIQRSKRRGGFGRAKFQLSCSVVDVSGSWNRDRPLDDRRPARVSDTGLEAGVFVRRRPVPAPGYPWALALPHVG